MNISVIIIFLSMTFTSGTTRYYLVRHAEKACEDCKNCGLKIPEGMDRAKTLTSELSKFGIDNIFASQCLRTQKTAEPLSKQLNMPITVYHTDELGAFIRTLKSYHTNRDVLIVGHSDQVPAIVEALAHTQVRIGANDYDNLYIITKRRFIRTRTTFEHRTYGVATP